jgi:hypothetical protein
VARRTRGAVSVKRLVVTLGAAATLLGGVGLSTAGAQAPPDLAPSLHGAVETQGLTVGVGALSLFVDPGTAYAYSTLDRDDYGGGSISYTMTARGANLNLGTIPYAVLWAPPVCEPEPNYPCIASGGLGTPNTGLHEAGGFPAYAEALYPPPPTEGAGAGASRERVYKCVVNKDAPGAAPTNGSPAEICRSSDAIPLSAWAEAVGDEVRSFGFSRAGGFEVPGVIKVAGSESRSEVKAVEGGKLSSSGHSVVQDVSIAGGQIRISSSSASGSILGGADGQADRAVDCGFERLTIGGEVVGVDELESGGAQPLLDGVEQATGFRVEIIPPTPPVTEVREGGKQVAECTGIRIIITDVRTGSPVPVCAPPIDPNVPECVPAFGNRFEFTFARISVAQSVNLFAGPPPVGTSDVIDPGLLPDVGSAAGTEVLGAGISAPETPAGALPINTGGGAGGGTGAGSGGGGLESATGPFSVPGASGDYNLALIGGLTAAGATAIGLVVLLLIGVVGSLATGGPLRIPGIWR